MQEWIAALVLRGSGRIDADLLRDAYQAAQGCDSARLAEVNRRGLAYRPTSELALESGQQGESFLAAWQGAWIDGHPTGAEASASLPHVAGQGGKQGEAGEGWFAAE